MKKVNSINWSIFIVIFTCNFLNSQDKDFHQVVFGDQNMTTISQSSIYNHEISNGILQIQSNFKMAYIWIYNNTGFDYFSQIDTNFVSYNLPDGNYNIFTGYAPQMNHHTFIIEENIIVNGNSELNLYFEDAIYSNIYSFKKINANTLNISTIAFYFLNQLTVPDLSIKHMNFDSSYFLIKHNSLPSHFDGEWAAKGKPFYNDRDLYLLNRHLNFYETDTTISNQIQHYANADIDYFLPDSIPSSSYQIIFTYIPDFHKRGNGDIFYYDPIVQRIYQDTSADKNLRSSKFNQSIMDGSLTTDPYHYVNTSEMSFSSGRIIGFHYRDPEAPTYIISDTNYVKLGQTPAFWFGKFLNSIDTIKIRSSYGRWEYLFLSQTNDVLKHYPIEYKLYEDNAIIKSGLFDLFYGPWALRLGFNQEDLTIPILPAKYLLNVKDSFCEVGGLHGYSEVNASFDLNNSDKNPPNIVSFQLLSGKEITHIFYNNSNNKIRFIAEDNVLIDSVSLYYSYLIDTIKYEIPLIFNEPYFEGFLPVLPSGFFNLHTLIRDNSNNYIECNMFPAFLVDSSVLTIDDPITISDEFILNQNYPNPFNSLTNISFNISSIYTGKINISIYNILGQHIKTLLDIGSKAYENKVIWDGYDESNNAVPSGIYFINMKGGMHRVTKKILLIK